MIDLNTLTMAAFTLEESNHSFAPFSANLQEKNHSPVQTIQRNRKGVTAVK